MTFDYLHLSEQEQQTVNSFFEKIKVNCEKNNISFNIQNTKRVPLYNYECGGYFEPELKKDGKIFSELAVATDMPFDDWFQIFIHESCHVDQWLGKSNIWIPSSEYSKSDAWLDGQDFPQEEISNLMYKIIILEADCEIRSLEKIKKYNLPVDCKIYSKKANAYLFFHHWMLEQRAWCDISPYSIQAILDVMPDHMLTLNDYIKPLDEKTLRLFDQCRKVVDAITV
jgi:hypothetical protein